MSTNVLLQKIFEPADKLFMANMENGIPLQSYFGPAAGAIGSEFYSINPIKVVDPDGSPRKGINVTTFRNFMFECDGADLDYQLAAWKIVAEHLPITMVTYSGGKSYHAIISLLDTPPWTPHTERGVMDYRRAWKALAGRIQALAPELELDMATKDPSRLSRTPMAVRTSNSRTQSAIIDPAFGRYISTAEVLELVNKLPDEQNASRVIDSEIKTLHQFEVILQSQPKLRSLYFKLFAAPQEWARPESMYPVLFRLTLWAIDATNVPEHIFLDYLRKHTFPVILNRGYTRDLAKPVANAFLYKES